MFYMEITELERVNKALYDAETAFDQEREDIIKRMNKLHIHTYIYA